MKWMCCLPLFALSGCIYALLGAGIAATNDPVKVVPASEAPAPPPGDGWSCFDYRVTKYDTHDGKSDVSGDDACYRTLGKCQQEANGLAAMPASTGSRTSTSYQVGTCVQQPKAACTYWFASKKHECARSLESCNRSNGGMMMVPKGTDARVTECAEYP